MKHIRLSVRVLICLWLVQWPLAEEGDLPNQSGAGNALDLWTMERSYPDGYLDPDNFYRAFEERSSAIGLRNPLPPWSAIGPKNIAGRTLALAFHPTDPETIFLGSASGGLWKTTTGGVGANAWTRVPTGFPILGVAAILINPENPNEMYIGTGEVYNSEAAEPGIVNRLTRGTYGMGILKSTDGGISWFKSLDWALENFRGIQDLKFHPEDVSTLFAATTMGLMKSIDSGNNWDLIHDIPMAVDVEIHPADPQIIHVAHGSLFHEFSGVYRSEDGGRSFVLVSETHLPRGFSGKAAIAHDPSNPDVLFASVANAFESIGLYETTDAGNTWQKRNSEDVAKWQGWYSHDIAINPTDRDNLVHVGIDAWNSNTAGRSFIRRGIWDDRYRGKIEAGDPEGPPNYVHSDIHKAYFHPLLKNYVFLATDGGVFVSADGGTTYRSRNGGLQTSQFYANFSNSSTDSTFAIGGLQDNNSTIYDGTDSWIRILGGDGMSAAIDPLNDDIVYGSSQRLWIYRSIDRGKTFNRVKRGGDDPIFSAPFELAPSDPSVLYAGSAVLEKSVDFGVTWQSTRADVVDGGNGILTIGVSPTDHNRLILSTAPSVKAKAGVFLSDDGGETLRRLTGFPDQIARDILFHPTETEIMYAVLSGYNDHHVVKSVDGGDSWSPIDEGLPDIPHNTIVVDPENSEHLYVGNDLGVYFSPNDGKTWQPMSMGLPEAVFAMHLSLSPANRKVRLATHGNGVWEADLVHRASTNTPTSPEEAAGQVFRVYPNPVVNFSQFVFTASKRSKARLSIFDSKGALIKTVEKNIERMGVHRLSVDQSRLAAGVYWCRLIIRDQNGNENRYPVQKLIKM